MKEIEDELVRAEGKVCRFHRYLVDLALRIAERIPDRKPVDVFPLFSCVFTVFMW